MGTTVNADISLDYPTLQVGEDGEFYYEYTRDIHNKVNETRRQIEKDGYSIGRLSAAVVVRSNNDLTGDDETRWRNTIANAIGADIENVSIKTTPFIETTDPIMGTALNVGSVSSQSMVMIAVIVILGVVLIVLLILALNAPGSRKKRRNAAHLVSTPIPVTEAGEVFYDEGGDVGKVDDSEFELTSLNEEMPETRDEALKREIKDFSKNNPEIVAQLIRSWLRGED